MKEIHIHIHDGDAKVATKLLGDGSLDLLNIVTERLTALELRVRDLERLGDKESVYPKVWPDERREVAKIEVPVKKKGGWKLDPAPPAKEHCTTQAGAAVALIADGMNAMSALVEAEVLEPGSNKSLAGAFANRHRFHIIAMKNLPPGQERFDYLQKHYRWGT